MEKRLSSYTFNVGIYNTRTFIIHFPTILNYMDKNLLYLLVHTVKFGQFKKLDRNIDKYKNKPIYKSVLNYENEYKN